jgi:hypothetical protein
MVKTLFSSGENYKAGRYNEGNRDLNRDFPNWMELDANKSNLDVGRQPETKVSAFKRVVFRDPNWYFLLGWLCSLSTNLFRPGRL